MPFNSCTKDLDSLAKQLLFWEVDLPSAAGLKQELVRWKLFWNEGRREDKPEDLMDALPCADDDIFPNISQLILIGCMTPIGACQAERSFSVLRRAKTPLGSTMTEERLTGLTMMSVHHAECLSLQTETVVRRFVQDKLRRLFCNSIMFDESED